jgi:hypothetical protein
MNVPVCRRVRRAVRRSPYVFPLLFFLGVTLTGCAATPDKPDTRGVIFPHPPEVVQPAAIDALVVLGFDVKKSDPLYVEGFKPRKMGLITGSGGETVGIWLEPLDVSTTRVLFDTAKSYVGFAHQRNWNNAILEEMEKSLAKKQ